jgi:hypothetical protein
MAQSVKEGVDAVGCEGVLLQVPETLSSKLIHSLCYGTLLIKL